MKYLLYLLCSFTFFFTACDQAPSGTSGDDASATEPITSPVPAAAPKKDVAATDDHLRPSYHFTPPSAWMNDPNGMVYHEGEWHLFYQYYPDGNTWGPMHWGHAVSTDLVNWEHLPIALYPDDDGYIFSGSAVIDKDNTAGFGANAMIAIYTIHDIKGEKAGRDDYESQGIAYSTDKGRTWTKYEGNPVLPSKDDNDFRDPKVMWDKKTNTWLMTLAVGDHIEFYNSANLKVWNYLSSWGKGTPQHWGVWECPELIPMTVEGTNEEVHVLLISTGKGGANGGSGTFYYTGYWDGKFFQPLREATYSPTDTVKWLDYGRDNYAGVTFNNTPDGRTIFMGWMSNWEYAQKVPTESWRSAMTIPRELTLHRNDFGTRLHQKPVKELEKLRGNQRKLIEGRIQHGLTVIDLSDLPEPGVFELDVEIDLHGNSEELSFTLSNDNGDQFYRFGYSRRQGFSYPYFTDRRSSGLTDFDESFAPDKLTVAEQYSNDAVTRFHAFFDRTSAEIFFHDGEPVVTEIFFPKEPYTKLTIESSGGQKDMDGDIGWDLYKAVLWPLTKN